MQIISKYEITELCISEKKFCDNIEFGSINFISSEILISKACSYINCYIFEFSSKSCIIFQNEYIFYKFIIFKINNIATSNHTFYLINEKKNIF